MKIRKQKTSYIDLKPRFQSKYKRLQHLNFNFLNTNKVLKLHRQKWNFLRKRNKERFYYRIFSNINNRLVLKSIKFKEPIRHPKYMYRYKAILNAKRIFKIWYSIKRMKVPGNLYFKQSCFIDNKKIFRVSKLLSLIFQFEKRLDVILLRSFFFSSLYYVQKLILQKNILVNTKYITVFNTYLQIGDLIEVKTFKNNLFNVSDSVIPHSFSKTVLKFTFNNLKLLTRLMFFSFKKQLTVLKDSFLTESNVLFIKKFQKQLNFLYNFTTHKANRLLLKVISLKNEVFYRFFSLNLMLKIYMHSAKTKKEIAMDNESLNILLKKYIKKKRIKNFLNVQTENPFFYEKQTSTLNKFNLISNLKVKSYYTFKNIQTKKIFFIFKHYSQDNLNYVKTFNFLQIDKTRLLILYNIKKNLTYKYKPKFLMLLNYFHLEINYNILAIRLQQPFLNHLQLKVLYPFRFNYQVLQEYFDNNH